MQKLLRLRSLFARKRTQEPPKGKRRVIGIVMLGVALLLFGGGAYLLFLTLGQPAYMPPVSENWNQPVAHAPSALTENRLYIPKLKLNLSYKSGDQRVLRDNIWHRYPERGDPEKGGNFILAGHRFELGLTPGETKYKSPFYYINKLALGDKIYADFNGKRYEYTIVSRSTVQPNDIAIEAPSAEPKMTLYTCTLKGTSDGREVIIAHVTATNVDPTLKF